MRQQVSDWTTTSIRSGMDTMTTFYTDEFCEDIAVRLHVREPRTIEGMTETLCWVRIGEDHWQAVTHDNSPISVARAETKEPDHEAMPPLGGWRCGLCEMPVGWITHIRIIDGQPRIVDDWQPHHVNNEGVPFCDDCAAEDPRLTTEFVGFNL